MNTDAENQNCTKDKPANPQSDGTDTNSHYYDAKPELILPKNYPESAMSDTNPSSLPPREPPLLFYLIGFLLALACALWSGLEFSRSDSSIGYGALTGLCFGAVFAFGQRIKNRLFPAPPPDKWKVSSPPAAAGLRPAQRAAMRAKPLSVEFDDSEIRTMRNDALQESIAWGEIAHIVISINDGVPPMPYWLITRENGSSGIRIPNDTAGLDALMEACPVKLSGYDSSTADAAIIAAMGAVKGSFEVWQKTNKAN